MENTQIAYTDKELSETARTARKYIKRDHPSAMPHKPKDRTAPCARCHGRTVTARMIFATLKIGSKAEH